MATPAQRCAGVVRVARRRSVYSISSTLANCAVVDHVEVLQVEVLHVEVLQVEVLHVEVAQVEVLQVEVLQVEVLYVTVPLGPTSCSLIVSP